MALHVVAILRAECQVVTGFLTPVLVMAALQVSQPIASRLVGRQRCTLSRL